MTDKHNRVGPDGRPIEADRVYLERLISDIINGLENLPNDTKLLKKKLREAEKWSKRKPKAVD